MIIIPEFNYPCRTNISNCAYGLFLTAPQFVVYQVRLYRKYVKEVFMFMKLRDIVSIVVDKGTNLLVAD